MTPLAARLLQHLKAQSLPVVDVRIGDEANRATWKVHPADQQAAAQPFIDAFVVPDAAQQLTDLATLSSRQKDVLATIAWSVRFRDVAAWNAMTLAQKRAAVFQQADIWRDIRVFIEGL